MRVSVFVSLCAFSPHHDICQSFFILRFFGPNDVFDDGKSIWWRENDGFNEFPQISQIINYNPLLMLPSLLVIVVVAHRSSNNNTNRRNSVSNGSVGYYQLYRFSNKFSNQIGNRCSSSILSTNVWVCVCECVREILLLQIAVTRVALRLWNVINKLRNIKKQCFLFFSSPLSLFIQWECHQRPLWTPTKKNYK